jgi:hypothetical protein
MDTDQLSVFLAFAAGLLSFLSPCVLPGRGSSMYLPNGCYFCRIINGGNEMTRRLIFVLAALIACGFQAVAADNSPAVPEEVARAFAEAGLPVLRQRIPAFEVLLNSSH